MEEVVERVEEKGKWFAGIEQRDIKEQRKEKWKKINESDYIASGTK